MTTAPRLEPTAALPRVAVVGSGIAGLAAAWTLTREGSAHVSLFEAGDHFGGHARRLPAELKHHLPERPCHQDGHDDKHRGRSRRPALGIPGRGGWGRRPTRRHGRDEK